MLVQSSDAVVAVARSVDICFTLHAVREVDSYFSFDDLLSSLPEETDSSSGTGATFSSLECVEPETVADVWKMFEKHIILKVHGCVSDPSSITVSHRGWQRLLHDAGYRTFMLSLMASATALYMGFSFRDE